jgi:hypothetical protein
MIICRAGGRSKMKNIIDSASYFNGFTDIVFNKRKILFFMQLHDIGGIARQ